MSRLQRLPGLDTLRAAAILLVLVAHYPKTGSGLLVRMMNFGWIGVDLFFVLSGYLIAGQLFKPMSASEPVSLPKFYLRRILRTLPSYFAVLAVYFFLTPAPNWKFFFFLQNFGMPVTFAPSWSLCVEEQFYLFFPILALFLSPRMRAATVPALLVSGIFLRAAIWMVHRPDLLAEPQALTTYMATIYNPTYCRLDGIVLGVGLAGLKYFHREHWKRLMERGNVLLGGGVAFLAIAAAALWRHYSFAGSTIGFTALNFAFASFAAAALSPGTLLGRWRIPGAKTVALLSYAIYLTHTLAIEATERICASLSFPFASAAGAAVAAALILLFAVLLYLAIERPALSLRDRLAPSALPVTAEKEMAREFAEVS